MPSKAVLGLNACQSLNLIQVVMNIEGEKKFLDKKTILEQYPDVFSGMGCVPGEVHIKLKPGIEPTIHPPRKVPLALEDKIKQELQIWRR